jgi:hypothetical protein
MAQCAAVRNKKSDLQCTAAAILGCALCGVHARSSKVRLWADVHREKFKGLVKIQALWRGWCVRKVILMAGPGALRRKDCVNDEDLSTLDDKNRQSPFEYFGIDEGGKIWWFDFATAWEWFTRSVAPTNPYTKNPIAYTDLTRLRKLHLYRRRHRLPVPPPPKDLKENIVRRWTILSHVFRGYGFEDIHPEQFANLTRENLRVAFRFLADDLAAMPRQNIRVSGMTDRALAYTTTSGVTYTINTLNLMTIMLTDTQSYDIVFLLLSALYRC